MVLKTQTSDHNLALIGLLHENMTPKIYETGAYSSPLTATISTPRRKQVAKQYQSNKWQSNGSVGDRQSPTGRSQEDQPPKRQSPTGRFQENQQLKRQSPVGRFQENQQPKRQSPKSYSPHNAHSAFQQQQHSPFIKQQTQRNSPSRISPTAKGSPTMFNNGGAYAGAKFSEPPAPESLPKPPIHWMNSVGASSAVNCSFDFAANKPLAWGGKCCAEISDQIKILLNMQA